MSIKPEPSQSLRICLLGYRSHPYGGGQGVYLKYLSQALVSMGHQVDVISGQPYPHLSDEVTLIKLPGLNLYENGLGSLKLKHLTSWANIVEWCSKLTGGFAEPYSFGRRVNAYLKKHGHHYDIIHDNQTLSKSSLSIQARQPFVTTIHHPVTRDFRIALDACATENDKKWVTRWYSFLNMQKKVACQLKHVITVSECSKEDIISDFKIDPNRIEVLYNGIDIEQFKPNPSIEREPFRLIATASADAPMKGLSYLLKAYANLLKRYPHLSLLVVGQLKQGGETEALLKQLNIVENVEFVSSITTDELVNYYAQATIAVIPSLYEGFGLPAGEAMACGVPVVSTTGGALPEVVGDAGVLVPPADERALSDAIAALLEDSRLQATLSQSGQAYIQEHFSWQKLARDMTQYYLQVKADYEHDAELTCPEAQTRAFLR
jgi:glycosyltransferase involved in cell wall biosynthesis